MRGRPACARTRRSCHFGGVPTRSRGRLGGPEWACPYRRDDQIPPGGRIRASVRRLNQIVGERRPATRLVPALLELTVATPGVTGAGPLLAWNAATTIGRGGRYASATGPLAAGDLGVSSLLATSVALVARVRMSGIPRSRMGEFPLPAPRRPARPRSPAQDPPEGISRQRAGSLDPPGAPPPPWPEPIVVIGYRDRALDEDSIHCGNQAAWHAGLSSVGGIPLPR